MGMIGFVGSVQNIAESIVSPLGIPEKDALLVVAISVSVLAVIVGIVDIRMRSAKPKNLSGDKLHRALEDLNLRVSDYISLTNNQIFKLSEQIKTIAIQVDKFEDFLLENPALGYKVKPLERTQALLDEVEERIDQMAETAVRDAVPVRVSSVKMGLSSTREKVLGSIKSILGFQKELNFEFFEKLEEVLIGCDLGVATTDALIERLRQVAKDYQQCDEKVLVAEIKHTLMEILGAEAATIRLSLADKIPTVILMVGVNGVGKTTTIGKLAREFSQQGAKVLIAAADTFRAAASEQVKIWGDRSSVEVVSGASGAKPSTVLFDAIKRLNNENFDVLLVDTAGRLHTRANLMSELESLSAMVRREVSGAKIETLLIVDGSTGQNALQQARDFHKAVSLTGIVVTKLDGSYKGGIVVAIKKELGIPIRYIGVGEGVDDLKTFDGLEFVNALLDDSDVEPINVAKSGIDLSEVSAKAQRKRR